MDNVEPRVSDAENSEEKLPGGAPPRRRGITSVTLGWIADRLRRTEKIKADLAQGAYSIDSQQLAKALLNQADEEAVKEG